MDSPAIMILLTDGYSDCDRTSLGYEEIGNRAKENNIQIYTIGVGSYVRVDDLTTLAEKSGGQFYPISNFSKLQEAFGKIIDDADIYTDSDEDGLSNYYEKRIAQSQIRLGTGATIPNVAQLDYENPDSDGDGLLDGEELLIQEREGGIYGYIVSFPTEKNSDGDKFDDYAEYMIGTDATKFRTFDDMEYDIYRSEVVINQNGAADIDGSEGDISATGVNVGSIVLKGIWIGTWRKMASENYWGYIHRQVQNRICSYNSNIQPEKGVLGGRVDLINNITSEVWEIKPISYLTNANKYQQGLEQLQRYIRNNPGYQKGGFQGIRYYDNFVSDDGMYTIQYVNLGNGMIIYSFAPKTKNPDLIIIENPETDPLFDPTQYYIDIPEKLPLFNYTPMEEEEIRHIQENGMTLDEEQLDLFCQVFGITVATVVVVGVVVYLIVNDTTIVGIIDDVWIVPILKGIIEKWMYIIDEMGGRLIPSLVP